MFIDFVSKNINKNSIHNKIVLRILNILSFSTFHHHVESKLELSSWVGKLGLEIPPLPVPVRNPNESSGKLHGSK